LLLSIGLVSLVSANAPIYNDIPDVKLFTNSVGLTPAFDLAQFNTAPDALGGDKATSYSITVDFKGLSSLAASAWSSYSSNVDVAGYSSATSGSNTFATANSGGPASASNKVKYSTYKINKLPKVGLSVGESVTVNVAGITSNAAGPAVPPSFGNPLALKNSDTTDVTAVWSADSSSVVITLVNSISGPVDVDVIASPVASGVSSDIDKERIEVYKNLFNNGSFVTAADTTAYGPQPVGAGTLGTISWLSAANGNTGIMAITAPDATVYEKVTPFPSNYVAFAAGQWYTVRMLISADAANTNLFGIYALSTSAAANVTADIAANVLAVGVPTAWTWVEAPFYSHVANNGFPQFVFKAAAAGSLYIDEIQVINAAPTLVDASRGNTRNFYKGGIFTTAASTTNWGPQIAPGATANPALSLVPDATIGSALGADFTGASGANVLGFKWTAETVGTSLYTPAATVGKEVGVRAQMTATGLTGNIGIVLVAALGVPTNTAISPLNQIIAAAEVGNIVSGNVRAIGVATQPFYQIQLEERSNISGTTNVANVDFDSDNDDPNFGAATLFP
jgi:hypothetical protein